MLKVNKTKKIVKAQSHDEWIVEKLKKEDLAVEYLNNALKNAFDGEKYSLELLLMALANVIQAHGGIAKIAKKAGLGRESLYKTVSAKGNPEFKTIAALTQALGLELRFAQASRS